MNHLEAVELNAVEQYLLNEMTEEQREIFEEHYFGCQECAADLRATAAFLDAAKVELGKKAETVNSAAKVARMPVISGVNRVQAGQGQTVQGRDQQMPGKVLTFSRQVAVIAALAAALLVIVYQNALVMPHLREQVAELKAPQVMSVLSLASAGSRGGDLPTIQVDGQQQFVLQFDIPPVPNEAISSYDCSLSSADGKVVWAVEISAEQAKDLVTLRVPAAEREAGTYTLTIQGVVPASTGRSETKVDVKSLSFNLTR